MVGLRLARYPEEIITKAVLDAMARHETLEDAIRRARELLELSPIENELLEPDLRIQVAEVWNAQNAS